LKYYLQILFLFLFIYSGISQDVESTYTTLKDRWQHNPVLISGGLGINTTYYHSGLNSNLSTPFMYNLYGNLDLDILGIQAPMGLFYSNKNSYYRLPAYHFVGVSPSYKQHTLHLGDRNMSFGPYSFDGMGYTGLGIESGLENWKVRAMYGRIRKATLRDAMVHNNLESAYRRMAWGAAIGYTKEDLELELNLFHAADDENSIPLANPDSIKPQSGTILGVKAAKSFGPVRVHVDYAYNVYNADKTLAELEGKHSVFGIFPGLQLYNNATGIYHAVKAGVDLAIVKQVLSLNYERIDPGYISVGTLYFNNDKETISGSLRASIFKNKVNAVISLGGERNNLAHDQINTYHRFVSSLNLSWLIDSKTSTNISFSNFSFDQKSYISPAPFIDLDTLVLTQNNLNYGISILRQLGGTDRLALQLTHNKARALNNGINNPSSEISNTLANLGYIHNDETHKLSLGASITYTHLSHFSGTNSMYGPTFNLNKKFFTDRLSSSLNTGYFFGKSNENKTGIFRIFWSNEFQWKKSITIGTQLMFTHANGDVRSKSNDFMANALFRYTLENKALIKTFSKKSKVNENNK